MYYGVELQQNSYIFHKFECNTKEYFEALEHMLCSIKGTLSTNLSATISYVLEECYYSTICTFSTNLGATMFYVLKEWYCSRIFTCSTNLNAVVKDTLQHEFSTFSHTVSHRNSQYVLIFADHVLHTGT